MLYRRRYPPVGRDGCPARHLSGTTTRKLCELAFKVYGGARYERMAGISNGHLYNLRQHDLTSAFNRHGGAVTAGHLLAASFAPQSPA